MTPKCVYKEFLLGIIVILFRNHVQGLPTQRDDNLSNADASSSHTQRTDEINNEDEKLQQSLKDTLTERTEVLKKDVENASNLPTIKRIENIKKSSQDKRLYRGLVLPNDLKVLLISDPDTNKAAVSISVQVGAMHDFDEVPGLAHFLEHMLFMGSEKYPEENYFDKFMQDHGGERNGYTYEDRTEYFFHISSDHLAPALDIMAHILLKPKMDPSASAREVKAVDSENIKNLPDDDWRISHLARTLSKPNHKHNRFMSGNLKSLVTDPEKKGISVREKLLELHSTWYSSNLMHLAVYGKEDLNVLEEMVVPIFGKIENKNMPKLVHDEHPWGPEQLKRKIYIVPVADQRYMFLRFPMPDIEQHYKTAPLDYLSELIGHEGPGSLYSELKERNWCEKLLSGFNTTPGFSFFYVEVYLTTEAMNHHINEIVKLIFQYIYLLKTEGVQERIFEEFKVINKTKFEYQSRKRPVNYVLSISSAMTDYPLEDVLSHNFLLDEWKPSLIKEFLGYLRPDNMNMVMVSKAYKTIPNLETEPWYGTKYFIEMIPDELIEKMWKIETPYRKFHLPPENDFIARDFKLYPKDENETKNPSLIHESSISQIWFKRDDEFELPTLHTKFILYSPVTCMNPNNMNLNMIFVELFKEKFTIYGYSAILAGFQYTVQPINCGILVHLFGYHEKLSLLLEKLISEIILFKFDKNRFEVAKEARIRKLENFDSDRLYNQANSYYSQYLIDSFGYSTEDYLATTKILQAHDMDMFMKRVFSRIFIQGFIYGNSDKQLAMKLVDILEDPFKSRSVVLPQELSFSRGLKIEEGSNLVYERSNKYHSNSCYYAFFQIGPGQTFVDIVLTELFVTIVREKCYKVLRTEEQLGYIVWCEVDPANTIGLVSFVVTIQSEKHPVYLNWRVESFFLNLEKTLAAMTEEEFALYKMSLKNVYEETVVNQEQRLVYHWHELALRRYHFDRRSAKVDVLEQLGKMEIIKFFKEYVYTPDKRRKLTIHLMSKKTNPEFPDNVPTKDVALGDVYTFRNSSSFFPPEIQHLDIAPLGTKI